MTARIKATLPLALVIGVLVYAWTQVALNFTFHWFTDGDLGNGLALPSSFHLIVPAAFVAWGFFFAAGADTSAFVKVATACVTGGLAALGAMALSSATAPVPDFWGIALWVGVFAVVLVVLSAFGDWHYVPASFGAFASTFFWWTATGRLRGSPLHAVHVGVVQHHGQPALRLPSRARVGPAHSAADPSHANRSRAGARPRQRLRRSAMPALPTDETRENR